MMNMTDEAKRIERCKKCPLCELQYIDNSQRMYLCIARKGYPCSQILTCNLDVKIKDNSINGFSTKTKFIEKLEVNEFDINKYKPFSVYKITFLEPCVGSDEHTYTHDIPAGETAICVLEAIDEESPTWLGFKAIDMMYELAFDINVNEISKFKIEQMKTLAEWKCDQSIPRMSGESLDD